MLFLSICILLLSVPALAVANDELHSITSANEYDDRDKYYFTNNQTDSINIDVTDEEIIDTILASNRQGRNLDGFDEVYSDPVVQQALQTGNDTQARNLIKEKLCSLGLMQCGYERGQIIEGKRPLQNPNNLVYSQSVLNGPYRRPPSQQPAGLKIMYGSPRPIPLMTRIGPPLKFAPGLVGQFHSGLPNSKGHFHNSKPFGSVSDPKFPYDFNQQTFITNEEYQALQETGALSGNNAPLKNLQNDGSGTTSVNIHHHYHHINGEANTPTNTADFQNLADKQQSANNEYIRPGHLIGHVHQGFPQTSFNNLNGGIYSGGTPGASINPTFAGDQTYDSKFVQSSIGVTNSDNSDTSAFGHPTGYSGLVTDSHHSVHPDYYKKALKANPNIHPSSIGQNYLGYESSRQDSLDCVCVSYNQCPVSDVLGRKGDLILPLDPRNPQSDIEALVDITNKTSNSNETLIADLHDGPDLENHTKKVSKREIEKEDSDTYKAAGEAVSPFITLHVPFNFYYLKIK